MIDETNHAAGGQAQERAREDIDRFSKQPRFTGETDSSTDAFFTSVWRWVDNIEDHEPKYVPNSRKRDEWLREFVRKEPHLLGVLNSVVAVDKNRGWSLTGGRNQVIRFTDIFHNWEGAPGMIGWRAGMSSAALSFYTSDLGSIVEVGRDGVGGPLRGLYHVDPVRCMLTGNGEKPLSYYPTRGKKQEWGYEDFLRVVSMPSTDENYHGLGYSAVSRAVELARLLIAIYQHDLEQMGAKAPRGLLLLRGISEVQWVNAMAARDAAMRSENYRYFDAVAVLASGAADVDAKLVALSQLPAGFDRKTFTDLLMYGYALVFGYDPIEFWPVQFGAMGRGNETQMQHDKATGKGGLDFALGFQEQLQENLPDTLQYDLDQRDQNADLMLAQIQKAWGDTVNTIKDFVTGDEARLLLAEREVIPVEWTEYSFDELMAEKQAEMFALQNAVKDPNATQDDQEQDPGSRGPKSDDSKSTDQDAERSRLVRAARDLARERSGGSWLKREREKAKERAAVWRAAEEFPTDPIVRYEWPLGRMVTLWSRGEDMKARSVFPAASIRHMDRADEESEVLYDDGDVLITTEDVDRAIREAGRRVGEDMADAMTNPPIEETE